MNTDFEFNTHQKQGLSLFNSAKIIYSAVMCQRKIMQTVFGIFILMLTSNVEISHEVSGYKIPTVSFTNNTSWKGGFLRKENLGKLKGQY